jgi:uncharacterized membrane protein
MTDRDNTPANRSHNDHRNQMVARGTGIGLCLGAAFGLLFDNLAIGMAFGLMLGVALGSALAAKQDSPGPGDRG